MYRAITLIELLTTLMVMVISFYFISPVFFRLQEDILLDNEVDQIKSFIYQIRTKASYQKKDYLVSINQSALNNQWCIIGFAKNQEILPHCNCLNIKSCNLKTDYALYQSSSNKIRLGSRNLYPKVFLNINGNSSNVDDRCLRLSLNNNDRILQIIPTGVVNVLQEKKRTNCSDL